MTSLATSFTNCIAELEDWMAANRLNLDTDKTEFVWIASLNRYRTLQNSNQSVVVGNAVLPTSFGTRNLDVYFDKHLDMKQHIINICRQSYYQLRQLRVSRSLPKDVIKTLLHAISSKFGRSSIWWFKKIRSHHATAT